MSNGAHQRIDAGLCADSQPAAPRRLHPDTDGQGFASVKQPTVHTDRPGGRTPSAYLHRRGDRKWFRDGRFTVLGRASLCSLALIAARFLRAVGRVRGREAPAQQSREVKDQAGLSRVDRQVAC